MAGLGMGLDLGLGQRGGGGPAAPVPEIWLTWGDSIGIGIYARAGGTDLDWPGIYQVRSRAVAGISADISPLDQAIAPTGTDYLSPTEYFAKQRVADIGQNVFLVPHNWNGTRLGTGFDWGVGNSLHEAFITRANAAIVTVKATYPSAVVKGIIQFEGSNDAVAGTPNTWKADCIAAIADMRSRIFMNGVSGANVSSTHYIIMGLIPEYYGGAYQAYEDAIREIGFTTTNGKVYKMPSAITTDNLHPNLAGNRTIGPLIAGLLTDVTGPTMTSPATGTGTEGITYSLSLTSNDAVGYSKFEINGGAGAAQFEIGNAYSTPVLRWVGNSTGPVAGTYVVGVRARDASGNYGATQTITITQNAAAAGTWSNWSQPVTTASESGWNSYMVRLIIPAADLPKTGTKFRCTMKAGPGGFRLDDMFFGPKGASAPDFSGTPTRCTFSAANGVTVAGGASITCDDTTITVNNVDYVISIKVNAASGDFRWIANATGVAVWYNSVISDPAAVTTSGFLNYGARNWLDGLEVYG